MSPRDLASVDAAHMGVLDQLIPAVWPPIWGDFARVFFVGLLEAKGIKAPIETLAQTALEQVRTLGVQLGGQQCYIPRGSLASARDVAASICAEFKGNNYSELATKYDLSDSRVRQILEEARRKRAQSPR